MSLYKQLWLAILLLLTLVFSVSFLVTTLSARDYLEQQLSMKNADNATALALSLTQQGADQVLLELTLSAQYDSGHYELIELVDPQGKATIRRMSDHSETGAPGWFINLFPIEVEPGVAEIQTGWQQAGTLTLMSHSRFAYEELWQNTLMLAGIFLLAAIAAGVIGSNLLKRILNPLADVVHQAESIGERRFITTPEPKTLEFRQMVSAMNNLSERIKSLLGKEANRLQKMQRESHFDKISGLYSREPFLKAVEAAIQSDDENSSGSLCIIRLSGLARLNQTFGRKATDELLKSVGNSVNRIGMQHSGWAGGRLNGSDFALLAPRKLEAGEIGLQLQTAIKAALIDHSMDEGALLPGGATSYGPRDKVGELLSRSDGALVAAERERTSSVTVAHKGDIPIMPVREQLEKWRSVLDKALRGNAFSLATFPVLDRDNKLIHQEAPVRLQHNGELIAAGQFLPWVHRLQYAADLDKQVVQLGLKKINADRQPVAINLSVAALADKGFLHWLEELLNTHTESTSLLWIEVPEAVAFRYMMNFKRLVSKVKKHGVRTGIEHMGHQLAEIGQLHDVGLDYFKVDASFVRDVNNNSGNETMLRTLCSIGHTLGVLVIAEGVNTNEEWQTLKEVGLDGATGPGISLPG